MIYSLAINFFNNKIIDKIITFLINKGVQIAIILIIYFILRKLGEYLINKTFKKYIKSSLIDNASRLATIETLTTNIYHYTLFFFLTYSLLSVFGIPVGSLLAGAGIAGVAIGLGAQGFINDFITGFFIILERQLEVGDYVNINNIEGTVTAVGLRTIQVKSPNGTLNFIPNRTITVIKNSSREDMRVLIDIKVDPDIDIKKATHVLEQVNETKKDEYKDEITVQPQVIGLTQVDSSTFVLRTQMFVKNGTQLNIQTSFLEYYLEALKEEGIKVSKIPNYTPNLAK